MTTGPGLRSGHDVQTVEKVLQVPQVQAVERVIPVHSVSVPQVQALEPMIPVLPVSVPQVQAEEQMIPVLPVSVRQVQAVEPMMMIPVLQVQGPQVQLISQQRLLRLRARWTAWRKRSINSKRKSIGSCSICFLPPTRSIDDANGLPDAASLLASPFGNKQDLSTSFLNVINGD